MLGALSPRLTPSPGPSSSWRRCPGSNREPPLHCGGGVALCRVPRVAAGGLPSLAAATGPREGEGPGEGPKDPSRGRSRGPGRGAPEKNRVRNASPSRRPPARRNYFGLSSHVQLPKGGRGVGRIHFRGRGWGAGGRTSLGKAAAPPPPRSCSDRSARRWAPCAEPDLAPVGTAGGWGCPASVGSAQRWHRATAGGGARDRQGTPRVPRSLHT